MKHVLNRRIRAEVLEGAVDIEEAVVTAVETGEAIEAVGVGGDINLR